MKRIPQIKTVMTPFPYSVGIDDPVVRARELMEAHKIRHLPVVDGERIVGIVSDRWILGSCGSVAVKAGDKDPRIRDMALSEPLIFDVAEALDVVLSGMAEKDVGSAVILKDGKLAGIFTATDACRELVRLLRLLFPRGDRGDAA